MTRRFRKAAVGIGVGLAIGSGLVTAGSPPTPPAAIDSFTIVNTTSLDSANGLYLAVNYGIDGHGFMAEVVTTDIGLSSIPDPSKFTVINETTSYENGVAIKRYAVLVGRVICPMQAQSSTFVFNYLYDTVSIAGKRKFWVVFGYDPDMTNTLALTGTKVCRLLDQFHVNDNIYSAVASAGWYGAATAGNISTPIQSSTLAYTMPEVHPLDLEAEYVTSNADRVIRFKVNHMYGQMGRMFDKARARWKDQHGNFGAWVDVTDVSLTTVFVPDASLSTGGIYADICSLACPVSTLTAGDLLTQQIQVWPLCGGVSEIYDSINYEGSTFIDDMRQPQYIRYDPAGTFGQIFAVVDPTAAGPGVASPVLATATATRFPTWEAAITALKAACLASFARTNIDASCVYGYNVSGVDTVLALSGSITLANAPVNDTCWYIKQHPSNTAQLIFDVSASARNFPTQVIFDGTIARKSAAGSLAPNTGSALGKIIQVRGPTAGTLQELKIDTNTGSNPWCGANWDHIRYENVKFTSTTTPTPQHFGMGIIGSNKFYCKSALGVHNQTAAQMPVVPYSVICIRGHVAPNERGSGQPDNTGFIVSSAKMEKGTNGGTAQFAGASFAYTGRGGHLENFSYDAQAVNQDFGTGSDGTLFALDGIVNSYGCNPPLASDANATTGRNNTAYNDVAGSQGIKKHVRQRAMHDGRWAIKQAWFSYGTASPGRVANWKTWLQVGWMFNTMSFLRDPGIPPYIGGNAQAGSDNPYWAGAYRTPYSGYGVGVPAYTSNTQADTTLTGGTYQPTGTTSAAPNWGRVPAFHHTCKHDMKGALRLDDNTAMNGPCEHL